MRARLIAALLAFVVSAGIIMRSIGLAPLLVSEYSPRRAAYLANPALLWVNIAADLVTTLSYAILFAGFAVLIRRLRHLPGVKDYLWGIVAFMIFLAAGGLTNLLRIVSMWWPMYQFSVVLKIVCTVAIAPVTTLFTLKTPIFVASVRDFFNQSEKLRKSEEFLDRTNRLAGIGGWEVDLLTEEVIWSDETCSIHGAPAKYRPTLEGGLSMYARSAQPTIIAAVERAAAGGPGWDLELPVIRFDGRPIWARSVGAAEFKDGKVVRLSGAFQDITAQVEAREALRQADERVALAADSGEIGIWDWDIAQGKLTCDPWMYRLHGKDPARKDSYGLWRDHIHPEDEPRILKALEDAVRGAKAYDEEFRIVWEDGTVHTLRGTARVTRDAKGRALNMVGANWDVTESRQLLSQLAEQHERLRVTLHSIGDGVITTDAHNAVEWLNPVAELLTGWSAADAIGQQLRTVFRTFDSEAASLADLNCFNANEPGRASQDTILIARNGTAYGIESSAAPICNKTGDLLGSVLVFRDVTEKRRLTAEAEDATKLQLKLKDEFLSHVSHELRSPLTSIYSFTSIIADDLAGETTPQQKEYLEIVLKNVEQLQSMIEDLLTVTQSKEGKLTVHPVSLQPADALADAIHTVQSAAAKKNIQLSIDFCTTLPALYADPIRLRQVLIILLDNAVKFTPVAGQISLHAAVKDAESLLIQVKDSGCGIAEEKCALVFENLYQISDTTHADTSQAGRTGLGLGLHIARDLVHRQSGNIWVDSVINQGSTFNLTLPLYAKQDQEDAKDLRKTLPGRRKTDQPQPETNLLLMN